MIPVWEGKFTLENITNKFKCFLKKFCKWQYAMIRYLSI